VNAGFHQEEQGLKYKSQLIKENLSARLTFKVCPIHSLSKGMGEKTVSVYRPINNNQLWRAINEG